MLTLLPNGTSVAGAVSAIAASITNVAGVTATSTPTTVTVTGAAMVGCVILGDQRVGQPNDSFSSNCSLCCANEMGRVLAADLSVDTALIQIRSGTQYLSEIVAGNSPTGHNTVVTGVRTVVDADVNGSTPFHKRGITTNYTTGIAITLGTNGYIVNRPKDDSWHVFHRFYQNAMVFQGTGGSAFSDRGDSGSAVFDDAGNVVGTVFGGGTDSTGTKYSLVTPIEQITTSMNITVATATEANQVQTVTDAEGAPAVVAGGRRRAAHAGAHDPGAGHVHPSGETVRTADHAARQGSAEPRQRQPAGDRRVAPQWRPADPTRGAAVRRAARGTAAAGDRRAAADRAAVPHR